MQYRSRQNVCNCVFWLLTNRNGHHYMRAATRYTLIVIIKSWLKRARVYACVSVCVLGYRKRRLLVLLWARCVCLCIKCVRKNQLYSCSLVSLALVTVFFSSTQKNERYRRHHVENMAASALPTRYANIFKIIYILLFGHRRTYIFNQAQ